VSLAKSGSEIIKPAVSRPRNDAVTANSNAAGKDYIAKQLS